METGRTWKKLKETWRNCKGDNNKIRIWIKTRPGQGEMITRQEKLRVDNVLNNGSGELMNELLNYWIIEQMDESWINRGWTDALRAAFCDSVLWTVYAVGRCRYSSPTVCKPAKWPAQSTARKTGSVERQKQRQKSRKFHRTKREIWYSPRLT